MKLDERMKLDPRIIEGKKPLTAFDEMESKFIGTECYFSDNASDYGDLSNCQIGYLSSKDGKTGVFNATKNNSYANFNYCLPCEWVKELEKKYRPFSIEDWKFKHSIGETILYRYKGTYCGDHSEAELAYLGFIKPLDGITDEAGKGQIVLGNNAHGLQNLFDDYEMWVDGNWEPFGVLDEGDE